MTRPFYNYTFGFGISVLLTLAAAWLAWQHSGNHQFLSHGALMATFSLLAVLQLLAQAYFFLHVSDEKRPRWRATALVFALLVVAILVGGTMWIMHNLSHTHAENLPFIHNTIAPEFSND